MSGLLEPRRGLVVAIIATACSTYEPSLLKSDGGAVTGGAGLGGGGAGATVGTTSGAGAGAGAMAAGGVAAGTGNVAGADGLAGTPDGGEGPAPATVPYVNGIIGAPFISAGLTLEGTFDWAHWGLESAGAYNHKAGVVSQLLDFTPVGSVAPARFLSGATTFVWSDGTPTKSASTKDGISWQGVGEGFQLAVSAGTDKRKLQLYLGVYGGTGALTATLSDPRSVGSGNDRFTSDKPAWVLQVVTIQYGYADKPGTTLNVSWRVETATAANAAVCLTAMAISAD